MLNRRHKGRSCRCKFYPFSSPLSLYRRLVGPFIPDHLLDSNTDVFEDDFKSFWSTIFMVQCVCLSGHSSISDRSTYKSYLGLLEIPRTSVRSSARVSTRHYFCHGTPSPDPRRKSEVGRSLTSGATLSGVPGVWRTVGALELSSEKGSTRRSTLGPRPVVEPTSERLRGQSSTGPRTGCL